MAEPIVKKIKKSFKRGLGNEVLLLLLREGPFI